MESLPEPLDLSHHFSDVTNNREASDVKKFYKYFTTPGMRNLAAGEYFAFDPAA
jgi:site-specific recombinase XerD